MEKGRLTEEYRESFRDGQAVRLGPYYKHQCWQDGQNKSRRVPAPEVERLRKAVEGCHRFDELAQEYVAITMRMTQEAAGTQESKKKPKS